MQNRVVFINDLKYLEKFLGYLLTFCLFFLNHGLAYDKGRKS